MHLIRHHSKTMPGIARPHRLDGCVEGQQANNQPVTEAKCRVDANIVPENSALQG